MAESWPEELILEAVEPNGIAYVTINRPKSLNSLTKAMMTDLAQAFNALGRDDSIRVIVLSGSGRAFCSGADLTAAEDVFKGDVKDLEADPVAQMERCRKPIIGAVNGFAVTAGFEIALSCDILIAAKGAKFVDTHARFGIFPSWGLSQKLSRIIGLNKAREVSLTATPLTAEVAERSGFVNHVVEEGQLLNKAREVAEAIIKNNQDLVLRNEAVMIDGLKLDLGHALSLEKGCFKFNSKEITSKFSVVHLGTEIRHEVPRPEKERRVLLLEVLICYPGDEIPKWFSYQNMGCSVNMKLPPLWYRPNNFLGFALCFVVDNARNGDLEKEVYLNWEIHLKTNYNYERRLQCVSESTWCGSNEDLNQVLMTTHLHTSAFDFDSVVEMSCHFSFSDPLKRIKRCGIRLLCLREAIEFGITSGVMNEL